MFPSQLDLLYHIRDEIDFILNQTQSCNVDQLTNNSVLKRAVIRSLEIIGEASKKLSSDFRNLYPHLDWKEMADSRDKLIHHYFGIDYEINRGTTTIFDRQFGSQGAVLVQQGVVWETTFTFNEAQGLAYKSGREYGMGQVTGADVPDIHQLGNPDVSEQHLVTIHIYSPPLGVLHTYKPGSAKIDLYTPADPD